MKFNRTLKSESILMLVLLPCLLILPIQMVNRVKLLVDPILNLVHLLAICKVPRAHVVLPQFQVNFAPQLPILLCNEQHVVNYRCPCLCSESGHLVV